MSGCLIWVYAYDIALTTAYKPILRWAQNTIQGRLEAIRLNYEDNTIAPAVYKITLASDAGSGGTSQTAQKVNPDVQHTIQATFLKNPWSTTDPSAGTV